MSTKNRSGEIPIARGRPGLIINTGSKQGITTPPGNPAYNLSKAGVKVFTEALAHELRNTPSCRISAHLLIPGFVFTGLTRGDRTEKPPAAWTPEQTVDFMLERLEAGYRRALQSSLRRPGITNVLAAGAAALTILLAATVWREFLPVLDEGSIWLHAEMPPGISLQKAAEMTADLRRAVNEFPEVTYAVTHLGRNDDGTDPWTPSHIEVSVGLHPYDSWASGLSKAELVEKMGRRFAQLPGIDVGFSQPMIDGVLDKLAGAHSDLVVKVYGNDFQATRRLAESDEGKSWLRLETILPIGNPAADPVEIVDALIARCGLTVPLTAAQRDALIDYITDGGNKTSIDLSTTVTDDAQDFVRATLALIMQSAEAQIF